jgi:hypothetical protein
MQSQLLPLTQRHPDDALSEHVVFHSPVRDYSGRADVTHILTTIGGVLGEIEAHRELVSERELVTIITATHGEAPMSGVLHETYDDAGRVEGVTLLLRPLSALLEAIAAMRAALEQSPLPSTVSARST